MSWFRNEFLLPRLWHLSGREETVCEEPLLTVDRQMGLNIVHPEGKVHSKSGQYASCEASVLSSQRKQFSILFGMTQTQIALLSNVGPIVISLISPLRFLGEPLTGRCTFVQILDKTKVKLILQHIKLEFISST